MNKNIEDFMSINEPKFKLKKYTEEIDFLLKEGYTHEQILSYLLKYYDLKVTRQTLSTHIKHMKKTVRTVNKKSENENKTVGTVSQEERKNKLLNKLR